MVKRREMDGPPWGTYVDPDEAYLRGQAGQAGSGLLGGWSQAGFGGSLEVPHEAQGEVHGAVGELLRKRAAAALERPAVEDELERPAVEPPPARVASRG